MGGGGVRKQKQRQATCTCARCAFLFFCPQTIRISLDESEGAQGAKASEVQARPHDNLGLNPMHTPEAQRTQPSEPTRPKIATADHESDLHDMTSMSGPDAAKPTPPKQPEAKVSQSVAPWRRGNSPTTQRDGTQRQKARQASRKRMHQPHATKYRSKGVSRSFLQGNDSPTTQSDETCQRASSKCRGAGRQRGTTCTKGPRREEVKRSHSPPFEKEIEATDSEREPDEASR